MTQPLSSDEVRRAVKKFEHEVRTGDEDNYKVFANGQCTGRVTIPKGKKKAKWGTFKSQCKQANLSEDEMREAAACRFGRHEYEAVMKRRLGAAAPPTRP